MSIIDNAMLWRQFAISIDTLSSDDANRLCRFPWGEVPFGELLLYTMRHVQEHAAQLHLFLGQQAGKSSTHPG